MSWHAIAFLFWGGMDAFYICLYVFRSTERVAIPFWTDFKDALSNMQIWGGGLELIVWLGLILQLSLIATCGLLLMRCRLAVYLGNSEQVAHQSEMCGLGMPKSPLFSR
ncbi:hypothetical protein KMZ27_25995 [Pseudomonas shirazica]|nr:hypothetical protein [Pseudomonas shirazica]